MWKSTEKSVYTMKVKFINITSKLLTYDKKTRARSNVWKVYNTNHYYYMHGT